ncbi:MAG: hypothetical protein AAB288_03215, partial [Acidobacteriota bacterium]
RRIRRNPKTTRWALVRTQGKSRFVWYYGVLGLGVPIAIFKLCLDLSQRGGDFPVLSVLLNVLLLPICGLLVGVLTWSISERRYQQRHTSPDSEQIGKVV